MASPVVGMAILIFLCIFAEVSGLQRNEKCTSDDTRQIFPNCMFDDSTKTLWCDQSNYEKLPAVPEINSHLIDSDCKVARALYVNDSCLQKIEPDDLQPYGEIEHFVAGDNFITILKKRTFEMNKNLGQIDLCNNKIDHIEAKTFEGLKHLKTLHLNSNKIGRITPHTFHGLSSLEVLTMEHNRLEEIERHHFNHMKQLKTLNLRGNEISTINRNSFSKLKNLVNLHLDGNQLVVVHVDMFYGLQELKILTLSHNHLKSLPVFSGTPFTNLHTLHLGSNQIQEFMPAHVANLSSLQNLSLDNNSLAKIAEDLYLTTPRLRYLNLSRNYIDDIPVEAFNTLCHLESLILKGNQLKTPKIEWFQHIIKKNISETHTAISENSWKCDCETIKFQAFQDSLKNHQNLTGRILATRLQITCTLPQHVENRILDKNLADEIHLGENCPTTIASEVPKPTITAAAKPRDCNTTKSFKHENFDLASQYVPPKPRALAAEEPVETGGYQIWIIIMSIAAIGVVATTVLLVLHRKRITISCGTNPSPKNHKPSDPAKASCFSSTTEGEDDYGKV